MSTCWTPLSDLMIFFSVQDDEISILDVARPETLEMFREAKAKVHEEVS